MSRSIELAETKFAEAKLNSNFLSDGKKAIVEAQSKLVDLEKDIHMLLETQIADE